MIYEKEGFLLRKNMSNNKYGKCAICGLQRNLTFEHIPPRKAFNSSRVQRIENDNFINKVSGNDEKKPWDTAGIHGRIIQQGDGGYYLCDKCNQNAGSWYMNEYVDIARAVASSMANSDNTNYNYCSFGLKIYPLRFFKAIITMFCDLNDCYGDNSLRDFLLNKESNDFNSKKYSVYLYLVSPSSISLGRVIGSSIIGIGHTFLNMSEISTFPIGMQLYIDKPDDYTPRGLYINGYSESSYYQEVQCDFINLPVLEINSLIPNDFRTKNEFFPNT